MPKFSDDLFVHLEPPETVEWTLLGMRYPANNPEEVVLLLKWSGSDSPFLKEASKPLQKPLTDRSDEIERLLRLFAKLGVAGWRNVGIGESEPFSAKDCAELLARYFRARGHNAPGIGIDWAEGMMRYARTHEVFRKPAPVEAADLGNG
jgi:hypothetical protein